MAFVVLTVLVVAATAYVVGVAAPRQRDVTHRRDQRLRHGALDRRSWSRARCLALGYAMLCMLGVAAIALFLSTVVPTRRSPPRSARMACWSPRRCCSPSTRRTCSQPYLPTRYWLAFVDLFRDPILWRDVVRGVLLQVRLRRGVPRRCLGQLHDQGHHRLSHGAQPRRPGTDGSAAAELGCDHRDHRRRAGQRRRGRRSRSGAHRLHREVESRRRATPESGGTTVLSSVGPDRHPERAGGRLVAGVERAQQVAVGRQLLAGLGAGVDAESAGRARPGRCRGAASASVTTRRATRVAAEVGDPEPGDDAAGGVADHVDRRRAGRVERVSDRAGRGPRPGRAGRRCRRRAGRRR